MAIAQRLGRMSMPVRNLARAIASHEIWPLTVVVAASIASERALPSALAVAVALIATRWIARGVPSVRTPADWPILALALMGVVSLAVTAQMELTAPQVGRLWLGMTFYYGLVNWATSLKRLELVSLGLALSGLVLALGAPFGVEWVGAKFAFIPASLYERFIRLSPDTINPNVMAGYLALLLPCVAAPLLFVWNQLALWRKSLYGVVLTAMLIVLVLTQSRAGIAAAAIGLLVLAMLRWRWAWVGALALAALGLIFWRAIFTALATGVNFDGLPTRMEVWTRGWYMVQDFAFTGIGMGSFAYVTERFYPLVLQPTLPHAHNLVLQIAVDLGVPGLVAWLAVLSMVVVSAWRAYRRGVASGDRFLTGLTAGLLAAQVVLLFHGMFDAITWGMVRPAVLIWGLWGVAVAALHGTRDPAKLTEAGS